MDDFEAQKSSEESESGEEDDEDFLKEISEIEKTLLQNPYNYQYHLNLINLLRKLGELLKLRDARTKMSSLFPLTQTLWMEWIEDEKKFAESEEDHEYLVKLFELAVKDYLCPEVWFEYCQYAIRWMGQPDGLKKIRDVMERAIAAVGHHVMEGASIWELAREFENTILMSLQCHPGQVPTAENEEKVKKQTDRISTLFQNQLAIPLIDMEKSYEEFIAIFGDASPGVKHAYEQALKRLEEMKPFEEALLAAENPKLDEFQRYLDHEMKSGSISSVQCLFERCLVENCLNYDMWLKYLSYLKQQSSPADMLVNINQRSVRNCPWIGKLWILYLEALERTKASKDKLKEVFEEALNAGFSTAYEYTELWLTRCSQVRRMVSNGISSSDELSSCFESAVEYVKEKLLNSFSDSADPNYSIWTLWAQCEANVVGNVKKAEDILKSLFQNDVNARRKLIIWREYFNITHLHGGEEKVEKCRFILRQAVLNCAILPDPTYGGIPDAETACEMLVAFERQYGTIKDMDESRKKIDNKMSRIAQRRAKKAEAQSLEQKKNKQKQQKVKKQFQRKRKLSNEEGDFSASEVAPKQQKIASEASTVQVSDEFKTPGLPVRYVKKSARQQTDLPSQSDLTLANTQKDSSSVRLSNPPPGFQGPPPGFQGPPPGFKSDSSSKDENDNHNVEMESEDKVASIESTPDSAVADKTSIFISNLDYKLENVTEKLKDTFGSCGEIVDVRLVKNNKGQFRGFCYIQFSDEKSVQKALQMDRKNLGGRPMFVSPNVDKKKAPNFKVFKYDVGLEKHKLFVSNLSFHTSEDTLSREFSKLGILKEVRVVTNRRGQSKGLAYVEYEKESDAAQAVLKMDGVKIDDFAIKVAISNPPSRKTQQERKNPGSRGEQFKGGRGRGRTQLSMMVPRSVHRPEQTASNPAATSTKPSGGMSNKDFANLLLKR